MGSYFIMKKLIFCFLFSILFALEGNAQLTKPEPVYGTDVTIAEFNKVGGGVGFLFEIGRASRGCRGWGICDVIAFWIVIYKGAPVTQTQAISYVEGIKGNEHIIIKINNKLDENKFDSNFYLDKDLLSTDRKATIKKGIYKLDNSIGSFGGYKIPVNIN